MTFGTRSSAVSFLALGSLGTALWTRAASLAATVTLTLAVSTAYAASLQDNTVAPPAVGDSAPAINLSTPGGETVSLAEVLEEQKAVVIFLRGFPGYQCPLCSRQIREFIAKAEEFEKAGASLVLVYPGPGPEELLQQKAAQFLEGVELPSGIHLVVDPDYTVVNQWRLRWDEPRETAYPSTFVIDREGKIVFAKISQTHGDRSSAAAVLEALDD